MQNIIARGNAGQLIYTHVGGSPISKTDPLGLWTVTFGYFASAVAGIGGDVGGGVYVGYSNGQFYGGVYAAGNVGVGANISAAVLAV